MKKLRLRMVTHIANWWGIQAHMFPESLLSLLDLSGVLPLVSPNHLNVFQKVYNYYPSQATPLQIVSHQV